MDPDNLRRELDTWQGRKLRIAQTRYEVISLRHPPYYGGGEGLVQPVRDVSTQAVFSLKCYFEPSQERKRRAKLLCGLKLASVGTEDLLGGAPVTLIDSSLGAHVPFALLGKWCSGRDWRTFRGRAYEEAIDVDIPPGWPSLRIRLLWAYGLARAVQLLEQAGVIHCDISAGNVMVSHAGAGARISLVDFDGFCAPALGIRESAVRGAPEYAAKEVQNGTAAIGSDRVGMALLIQEFVLSGHPDYHGAVSSFEVQYTAADIVSGEVRADPFLQLYFRPLAELFDETFEAACPENRPAPQAWLDSLESVLKAGPLPATAAPFREPKVGVISAPMAWFGGVVVVVKDGKSSRWLDVPDGPGQLDLTRVGIPATLTRDSALALTMAASNGSMVAFEWRRAELKYSENGFQVDIGGPGRILDLATGRFVEVDGVILTGKPTA